MCHMIPILDRGHVLSLGKDSDEVGLVVESAVITDFRCTQRGIDKEFARLCDTQVVDVCDERDSCLLLEEMAECGVRHIDQFSYFGQRDLS